jgi:hypothetical protein
LAHTVWATNASLEDPHIKDDGHRPAKHAKQ